MSVGIPIITLEAIKEGNTAGPITFLVGVGLIYLIGK